MLKRAIAIRNTQARSKVPGPCPRYFAARTLAGLAGQVYTVRGGGAANWGQAGMQGAPRLPWPASLPLHLCRTSCAVLVLCKFSISDLHQAINEYREQCNGSVLSMARTIYRTVPGAATCCFWQRERAHQWVSPSCKWITSGFRARCSVAVRPDIWGDKVLAKRREGTRTGNCIVVAALLVAAAALLCSVYGIHELEPPALSPAVCCLALAPECPSKTASTS